MDVTETEPLTGVAETLLIPLTARVLESRRADTSYADPDAVAAAETLGVDLERYGREWTQLEAVVGRTVLLDAVVAGFLARHPEGQVVNLGAGLCTRASRLDNGRARWLHVDFPAVVAVRARALGHRERSEAFAGSALDDGWWALVDEARPTLFVAEGLLMYLEPEEVATLLTTLARRRPGAEVALEGISSFLLRGRFGQRSATLRDTGATFKWGLSRPETLCEMVPGAEILSVGHHAEVYPERWRWLRLTRPIRPLRQAMRVVHLRLPGAPS